MLKKEIQQVRKAVFPVAGLGTRFLPITKVLPKEMLPVLNRPLIQVAVEEAMEAGIEEFIFVISHGKQMLIQHFAEAPKLLEALESKNKTEQIASVKATTFAEGQIKTTLQETALGLGHAVWCAKELVGNEPFAVLLPDDVILNDKGCLSQMMASYRIHGGNMIASCEVERQDTSKYGILDIRGRTGNLLSVCGLVEKPAPEKAPSNVAVIGRYILQPEIFTHLSRHEKGAGGEIQLTDAMMNLLRDQQSFHGFLFEGERLDCGSEKGFVKAQIAFALERPDIASEIANYMQEKLWRYQQKNKERKCA